MKIEERKNINHIKYYIYIYINAITSMSDILLFSVILNDWFLRYKMHKKLFPLCFKLPTNIIVQSVQEILLDFETSLI